eukprot:COSAG06_NODE_49510_length_325_cov_0.522124_1_plen_51_part_10
MCGPHHLPLHLLVCAHHHRRLLQHHHQVRPNRHHQLAALHPSQRSRAVVMP